MFKFILGSVVLIISGMIFIPLAYEQFVIWDAGNPHGDESLIDKLLLPLTPYATSAEVNHSIDSQLSIAIIDVRSEEEYYESHIPGAILIPEQTLYEEIPKMFPDKDKTIYLYSNTGHRGAVSTRLLRSIGYERSFNIRGGIEEWQKANFRIDTYAPIYF